MNKEKEALKSAMIEAIRKGGAWFTTRQDKFIKIGFSEADNCYFARECYCKDGCLEGGAYSFGTDWFDISFHGRYIDIYVDPDTFRRWPISCSPERGTRYDDTDKCTGQAERILNFCTQADTEALAGVRDPYKISSVNFEAVMGSFC